MADTKLQTTSLPCDMYSGGREQHLPANICTTDPAAACDRITVGVFVGVDWTVRPTSPPGLAMQRCFRKRFPRMRAAPMRGRQSDGRRSTMGVLWPPTIGS